MDFLGYDEVSLFSLSFAFILMMLTDWELVKNSLLVSLNPLSFVYGISVIISMYLSIKHIWLKRAKTTKEVFFMVGGGGWLALSVAFVTLLNISHGDWLSIAFAWYAFLYNLLILWFMGLVSGLEIAREFMSDREASLVEAAVSTVLVAGLALFLRLHLEWPWWKATNACVFYTLGVNKAMLGLWHEWRSRKEAASG